MLTKQIMDIKSKLDDDTENDTEDNTEDDTEPEDDISYDKDDTDDEEIYFSHNI